MIPVPLEIAAVPAAFSADVVVLDDGAGRARPDLDAGAVAGDDVPREARAADDRPLSADDVDADAAVGKPDHAGRIGADEVALDDVAVGVGADHA